MKKKGIAREIGTAILAVIGLAIVLLIFFPNLLAGALAGVFNLLGLLPSTGEAAEFKGVVQIPPGLEHDYDILVSNIKSAKSNKDADKCLVYTSELNIPDGWTVRLSQNELVLINLKEGIDLPKKPAAIDGFEPCIIKGTDAISFYNSYLKEGPKSASIISPNIKNLEFSESEKIKFLFKSGNKFCFFPSYDDGSTSCDSPRSNGIDGIDDDCRFKMPYFENNLLNCDDATGTTSFVNQDEVKAEAQKISKAIQQGLTSSAERCLIEYEQLKIPDKGWRIGMIQKGNEVEFVEVSGNRVGHLDNEKITANLCLVEGVAASNLDKNVKSGTSLTPEFVAKERFSVSLEDDRYQINVGGPYDVGDEKDDGDDSKSYLNIKNDDEYRHLYKADKDHVCFLTLRQDSGGGCNSATSMGVDDDCYKGWVDNNKIQKCNIQDGKVLHIKIDPGDTPTETWAFHLTNDIDHGYGSGSFSSDYCNVYATNEEGGGADHSSIWHIKPGGRITRTASIGSISGGLDVPDGVFGEFIQSISENNKASANPAHNSETIGGKLYGIGSSSKTKCQDTEGHDGCKLFVNYPNENYNYQYWPKYGLICSNDKKWKVCQGDVEGDKMEIGGNTYECVKETFSAFGTNVNYYTWK